VTNTNAATVKYSTNYLIKRSPRSRIRSAGNK